MICIHCQTDCKFKEREGGRCSKCNHAFAFEPKSGDKFTDQGFSRMIEVVSSDGSVRFHFDHIYYQICRAKFKGHWRNLGIALMWLWPVVPLTLVASLLHRDHTQIAILLGVLVLVFLFEGYGITKKWRASPQTVQCEADAVRRLLDRWISVHGKPEGLIGPKHAPQPDKKKSNANQALQKEALDYSFDRAVICDRAETVDLLLANKFHFENNCAILGVDNYPPQVFDTVRKMLRNNPKLTVLVIHDATPQGCSLAQKLRSDSDWFTSNVKIVDVGLRPAHAKFFRGQVVAQQLAAADVVLPGISAEEALWLQHYSLALAAMRPEQLIKRLFRALTQAEDAPEKMQSDANAIDSDVVIFGEEASASDGGSDSFG